jgi:hypothetical protein
MTIKSFYPASRPALGIDFAQTKRLDPRITFTRASTATFVGADGLIQTAASGAPRFDHNPTTGESLGLLVEEARTNRLLYSTDFANAVWNKSFGTLTSNSLLAPDQTLTAALFQADGATTSFLSSGLYQTFSSIAAGTALCLSVYVKNNNATTVRIGLGVLNNQFQSTTYTFATNTFSGSAGTTGTAQSLGNGWIRIALSISSTLYGTARISILPDLTNSVYLWGAQLEVGAFPTSYIPTVASTVTRAADVATLSNANSSIFPTSAFTTVNSPFGTAGGGSTVKLVGPTIKRTAIYAGDLTQAQINTLAGVNDGFWRWRVTGAAFALPSFTTNGNVTVDWGDGVVETLTTAAHTFLDSNVYHTIGFRLNSGTFFKPNINNNATYKDRVIAVGPAPASMKLDAAGAFYIGAALKVFDATVDATGGTSFGDAWRSCSGLTSFPLINTAGVTNFGNTWNGCSGLTSFPLINTAAGTSFLNAWSGCSGLTSFPLINTVAATSLRGAWLTCSGLTSFPLINSAACANFLDSWNGCSGLTSFPLINTAAGTNFQEAWQSCSGLTSFPLINTAAGTNFQAAWQSCSSLTSFPLINTGAGTNFQGAWSGCSSLASFPLINTAGVTNFGNTWSGCSGLTSFPLINTAAGTSFGSAWDACSNLTSFPLINTGAGTIFTYTWRNCSSLTSFPLINLSAGTNFLNAWAGCSSLTSFPAISFTSATFFGDAWNSCANLSTFPANMFDTTGTLSSTAFIRAFNTCALTAASIENILTSLVTNGQSNITLGLSGGTNAGATTWTTAANTAYATLISRGWTITRNA